MPILHAESLDSILSCLKKLLLKVTNSKPEFEVDAAPRPHHHCCLPSACSPPAPVPLPAPCQACFLSLVNLGILRAGVSEDREE